MFKSDTYIVNTFNKLNNKVEEKYKQQGEDKGILANKKDEEKDLRHT